MVVWGPKRKYNYLMYLELGGLVAANAGLSRAHTGKLRAMFWRDQMGKLSLKGKDCLWEGSKLECSNYPETCSQTLVECLQCLINGSQGVLGS